MINLIITDLFSHHVDWYCYYVIKLIKKNFETDIDINIGFNIDHKLGSLIIDFQIEHVIILNKDKNEYLCGVHLLDLHLNKDIIIEYSKPNIAHIKKTIEDGKETKDYIEKLKKYIQKVVYISPIVHDFNFSSKNRNYIIFVHHENSRREKIRHEIDNNNIQTTLVDICFDTKKLKEIYDYSRIMINIHQNDTNHTFEELRVLSALIRGVIIVSEWSPYIEEIPYGKYIIWSEYDKIPETVLDVEKNYEFYQKKIFNKDLMSILKRMKIDNDIKITEKIKELLT